MTKLPSGVDINNLIDDLRIFSWEAAETLINYSRVIGDPEKKTKVISVSPKMSARSGLVGKNPPGPIWVQSFHGPENARKKRIFCLFSLVGI